MNKLLQRQLKRHLGWHDTEVIAATLQRTEQGDALQLPKLRQLLQAVDDA